MQWIINTKTLVSRLWLLKSRIRKNKGSYSFFEHIKMIKFLGLLIDWYLIAFTKILCRTFLKLRLRQFFIDLI